ncbi:hypothetical protein PRIPAC_80981 [Pristionchus pacificus]|uniref:G protein-coupled receptor n=1 Tax=Pristionchus pacificus TaxID=54126 RepID=A0A454XLN1_PRIPA|nr:hypothetical protein PRIPAC_80981 [Pristionchus pacificus]|eukprot:PDM72107.1 G protein-coupled receptor [Pristionchus pacificus]
MGKRRLQFLSTSLFIPHISYILAYFFTMTPREILSEKLKPFHNVTGCGLYGFADSTEFLPALTLAYLLICGTIVSVYIFWARIKLMRILRERTLNMSVRTRSTHESLTRILTIHAIMPIFVCTGMGSLVTAQLHGYHSVDIEGSILDIAVIPSLVNPVLTLYFVRPYRVFIASVICCVNRRISLVHSGGNYGDKAAPKLSLSQKMQPL